MKLIIDIPDKAYNRLLEEQHLPNRLDIEWVIVHGIPLEQMLEQIRAEIDRQEKWLLQAGYTAYNVDIALDAIKSVAEGSDKA